MQAQSQADELIEALRSLAADKDSAHAAAAAARAEAERLRRALNDGPAAAAAGGEPPPPAADRVFAGTRALGLSSIGRL